MSVNSKRHKKKVRRRKRLLDNAKRLHAKDDEDDQ
jgi:hypothetical protein